jgi:APA family basic amino acid/polyamine antiporter
MQRLNDAKTGSRPLGFWSTTALVVGHTIGVGIFLTPAELIGALASPALIFGLWLAFGGLALCGALTFVVLSAIASAGSLLLMAPRVYLAMSRDGVFPEALAKLHTGTNAPIRATVLLASMATLLVLSGTFQQILAFFMCPTLVFVALAASAVFVLRRHGRSASEFRSTGYPVTPALFVLLVVAVVVLVAIARPVPALSGFALVLAGLPVYGGLARRGAVRRRPGGLP